jgi:LuxR family maltose regulon positive regulatory protein
VRTKLVPPTVRPGLVERAGVLRRLADARDARVVSIVAPPGYGKTTVLGQWAAHDPRPFAWLSVDRRDNDPVVLLSYLAAALGGDGAFHAESLSTRAGVGDGVWSGGLARLGRAMALRRTPVVLVLDDAHRLEEQTCLDIVATLVDHVPPGSQIVFSGRVEPRVGLARLRVEGALVALGVDALALGDAEAGALLSAAGAELTPTEVADLNRHAEGWAAGLYLAALALANGDTSVSSFDGSDRFVTDYLRDEELKHTDPAVTDFLLRTSVLETMTGSLCDAVLERSDSARVLEQLERDNLFVIPLDHTRSAYRYHKLFREMLCAELERTDPAALGRLRRRAAAWCEQQGWVEEAIDYASAARDRKLLERLVVSNLFPFYRTGRVTTIEGWLAAFDDDKLAEHPEIAVFGTWVHCLRGRPEDAERWALAVESATGPETLSDGSKLRAHAALARALLCARGVEQMSADVATALSGLSPTSPLRPATMLLAGAAAMLQEDERAEPLLKEAAEAAAAVGAVWAGLVARSELALLAAARGDVTEAHAEAALASELVGEEPNADYALTAILHVANARIAIAEQKGARARQAIASAQRLRPSLTHALPWLSVQVRLELARAQLALGDRRGAALLLREADDILWRRPRLGSLVAAVARLHEEVAKAPDASDGWASTLTAAELRLLPLLTTHLSFREIAARLFVSRNTVKTQAISIYRKLDASSRSEAIERAVALGLVDAPSPSSDFTRSG